MSTGLRNDQVVRNRACHLSCTIRTRLTRILATLPTLKFGGKIQWCKRRNIDSHPLFVKWLKSVQQRGRKTSRFDHHTVRQNAGGDFPSPMFCVMFLYGNVINILCFVQIRSNLGSKARNGSRSGCNVGFWSTQRSVNRYLEDGGRVFGLT